MTDGLNEQILEFIKERFDSTDKRIAEGFGRINGSLGKHEEKLEEHDKWINKRRGIEGAAVFVIPLIISIGIAILFR